VRLFTYCIPYDDGAAPNPFWGLCSLVICKPRIRGAAEVGDWVAGTGSRHVPGLGDLSGHLVYAMKVTDKLTLAEYDSYCRTRNLKKIPAMRHLDPKRRLGDCIYDYSTDPPIQRPGPHRPANMAVDIGGHYALLSSHFFYFGANSVPIPDELKGIVKQGQGHRSNMNAEYLDRFVSWLEGPGIASGIHGQPQLFNGGSSPAVCAKGRAVEGAQELRWRRTTIPLPVVH
jgi:Nucleotide modification associated domain 2